MFNSKPTLYGLEYFPSLRNIASVEGDPGGGRDLDSSGYGRDSGGRDLGGGGYEGGGGAGGGSGDNRDTTSGTTGSTDSSTSSNASSSNVANTSGQPAWWTSQQFVNSANSASISANQQRASNPVLPSGTDVQYTGISANENEFMGTAGVTLGQNVQASAGQAQAGVASAGQASTQVQGPTATYQASQITNNQAMQASMQAAHMAINNNNLVSGQLVQLIQPGPNGEPPPWAQGAVRSAMQSLAARGMDVSSMAGGAIVSAIIDSSVPIAQANANVYTQFDFKNLDNEQQAQLVNAQQRSQFLLSNQAQDNAAKQFNAQSINQANQFYANMANQVMMFNASQRTAVSQSNAAQTTAVSQSNAALESANSQFNANVQNQRDMFNSQNAMAIQQSNVSWRRNINTANTQGQNKANETNALNRLNISNQANANQWQQFRDESSWAFTGSENSQDRATRLAAISMQSQFAMQMYDKRTQDAMFSGLGRFAMGLFGNVVNSAIKGAGGAPSGAANPPPSTNPAPGAGGPAPEVAQGNISSGTV